MVSYLVAEVRIVLVSVCVGVDCGPCELSVRGWEDTDRAAPSRSSIHGRKEKGKSQRVRTERGVYDGGGRREMG